MRIAFFVDSFPLVSETFILRQITGLIDLGHQVDIFADYSPPEDSPVHSEVIKYDLIARTKYIDGPLESTYWEMPVLPLTGRTWIPGSATSISNAIRVLKAIPHLSRCLLTAPGLTFKALDSSEYGYQAHSLSALYRLAALCSEFRQYDILHAHFGPVGNNFRFAKDLFDSPLIVTFYGYDLCTVPRKEGPKVYNKLFKKLDSVIAISDNAGKLLRTLGCPIDKIRRLNLGINLNDFPFQARTLKPNEKVKILTVARLVEIKGVDYSIKAVAKVMEKSAAVHYDIIGEGPERSKLERIIQELGLEKSITLHGAQNSKYVKQMMAQSHLFVLPSINLHGDQEGTPISLMEAQASGIPVVASQTGGIPDVIVDGYSGFLFPDRNTESLAERLLFLIDHPERWSELGRAGRAHIEQHYNVDKLNIRQVDMYQNLINDYKIAINKKFKGR